MVDMPKRRDGHFLRLTSDDSSISGLTVDYCGCLPEDHQNQQLGPHRSQQEECPHMRPARNWDTKFSLKHLPLSMQEKRSTKEWQQLQRLSIGCWESWRQSQCIVRRRLREQVARTIGSLQPWRNTLHIVEGKFGVGVKAYFTFLRYLVYLNLIHGLFLGGLALTPALLYRNNNKTQGFTGNDSGHVLDLFLGTGLLEHSPVFYGFYSPGPLDSPCLNSPLLFLVGVVSLLILSFIMVARRTVIGYKHTWILGNRYNFHISYKVFCGWDFCIQDPESAFLKHSVICKDVKLVLEEERYEHRTSQRTVRQWLQLYFLRGILNFLVISLLVGSFCLIHYATVISQKKRPDSWMLSLLIEYFPPMIMAVVNFLLPDLFRCISSFEDYSLTIQVNVTLVRSIFLKLASLGIFLLFLHRNLSPGQCWENQFGKEMYKLVVFDFLACVLNAVLVAYPRKLLLEKYPSCTLVRLMGKQKFLIPFNVLDLVYSQTVTWVGMFYCPLLPHISVLKLLLIFYVKKFILFRCCEPAQRTFRGSQSSVLFYFTLLLGLLMAVVVLGINANKFGPSRGCGPFADSGTILNVTVACMGILPGPAQRAFQYFTSEAFVLPLVLAEIIILTSFVSQGRANRKAIERLKDMLVMCSADKRYLVKKQSTWLRTLRGSLSQGSSEYRRPTERMDSSVLLRSVSTP